MIERILLTLLVLGFSTQGFARQKHALRVTLMDNEQQKCKEFIKDKDLKNQFSYASPLIDSDTILGCILTKRALVLGGLNVEFDFVSVPNSARERVMVLNGEAAMAVALQWDYWFEQFGDKVFQSNVVIRNGATEKGLFARPDTVDSIAIRAPGDLKRLSVVSTDNWVIDWKTLKKLGFKSIENAQTRNAMFRMVDSKHADVTLQAFANTPDLSIEDSGIKLLPIRGVKIALSGSRHWMVSKIHPDGKRVFKALNAGIKKLRALKEIDRALRESGLIHSAVKDWMLITVE